MLEKYDLHCHSNASDGMLTPTDVVQRAHQQGVTVLALTDHDTVAGIPEAKCAANKIGLKLINGIEISANFLNQCLHIIGLNIDPEHPPLLENLLKQQNVRADRAKRISEKLEKKHILGTYEAIKKHVGPSEITRLHFADFLLTNHHVKTQQEAFDRYLGKGKSAYVPTHWVELEQAIEWINSAGGIAIVAHPLRYKLGVKWMNNMLTAFKAMGGIGIEIINARGTDDEIRLSCHFAETHDLYGSVGSDFHNPENDWLELGLLRQLPGKIKPVWDLF